MSLLRRNPPGRENPVTAAAISNPPIPKKAVPHTAPSKAGVMVHWANWMLNTQRGKLQYSETANRSELFNCALGVVPAGTHADCSQFYSACAHWAGVKIVNDRDWTGTLLAKGKKVSDPVPGCCVVFGLAPGVHAAMATEHDGTDWWCVGFGHQGAPDRVPLSALKAYFAKQGHPGVTYLVFG